MIEVIQAHDGRLTKLEGLVEKLSGEMTNFMAQFRNQRKFDPREVITYIKDIGILIGMTAGAIIWIATSISSAPLGSVQKDLAYISVRLEAMESAARITTAYRSPHVDPLTAR